MDDIAIKAENLGKLYQLGASARTGTRYRTLRDTLAEGAQQLLRRNGSRKSKTEEFWALRDVSFQIKQGEVIGIIGRNGAGKSTLLKILSRITEPTTGRVAIKGRVASLLEVGTGFHPELTGRENIFLNGAILGMSRVEIVRKFDEIVAFSEVEQFLDTPVKRYSSGMYVRMAFAVAAHLEPEILVVDEVLAVGDAEFQKKCLGKMGEVARGGRTVLFVSHNMPAVSRLTSRCLVLTNGKVLLDGPTQAAVDFYFQSGMQREGAHYDFRNANRPFGGNRDALLVSAAFARARPIFEQDESIDFHVTVRAELAVRALRFSMTIFGVDGTAVGTTYSRDQVDLRAGALQTLQVELPNPRLAPGRYYCTVAIGSGYCFEERVDFDVVPDVLHFEIATVNSASGAVAYWNDTWGKVLLPDMRMGPAS